jgi:hypothetical protein
MAIIKESRTLEVLNGSSTGPKFRHKYVHYMLKKRYIETKTAGKGSYRLEKELLGRLMSIENIQIREKLMHIFFQTS